MKNKLLVFGFLSAISIMIIIVIYALHTNQQTIISFESGEKHFKSIATAATEVSSYAKRAEGHLLLYLALHAKADKEKFPKRITSLHEQLSILDQKIGSPEARIIFEKIKANTGRLLSDGNTLIAYHDKVLEDKGNFKIEDHQEAILEVHENFSAIRELGVNLAECEIKLETDLKSKILENETRLRSHLLFLIILTFGITVFLGYILNRNLKALNKEIVKRIQSEKAIQSERDKLKDALANVKILSGLLPICASCKKIRDDKGYWNQIETYIKDHSGAEFSHSICPECAKKLYPDFLEDKEQ